MLGLGEETRVGAPPTPPWACACTMVAAGCVVPNVLVMGLATKPSAKTTPGPQEGAQRRLAASGRLSGKDSPAPFGCGVTGFCFSLALLLLLSDDGRRLDALRRSRRVERLHADGRLLDALSGDGRRLDALGADLCRGQPDPVHRHQLHVVQVDGGGHAHSSLGGHR